MPCVTRFSSSRIATTRALSFFRSARSFGPSDEGGFEELEQLVLSLSSYSRSCAHNSSMSAFASLISEATGGCAANFDFFFFMLSA